MAHAVGDEVIAMGEELVFSTVSKCFAPASKADWEELTQGSAWQDFLDTARRMLQQTEIGTPDLPAREARVPRSLGEFLTAGELDALFAPPSWEDKQAFAARHFTGGLPVSAPPIESLYRLPNGTYGPGTVPAPDALPGTTGLPGAYGGDPARYMRELVARMGLKIPPEFSDCPDHLSLELDLLAVMLRGGMAHQAASFLKERLAWLSAYRLRLVGLASDADTSFYLGLVDVLLGVWSLHAAATASAAIPA